MNKFLHTLLSTVAASALTVTAGALQHLDLSHLPAYAIPVVTVAVSFAVNYLENLVGKVNPPATK